MLGEPSPVRGRVTPPGIATHNPAPDGARLANLDFHLISSGHIFHNRVYARLPYSTVGVIAMATVRNAPLCGHGRRSSIGGWMFVDDERINSCSHAFRSGAN